MDPQSRLSLSFYREIAAINKEHHIYLVQHINTGKIYVKKILDIYNSHIFHQLMEHPVKGIPKIYAIFEEDEKLIVIEEYISGDTLEECLKKKGNLKEAIVADYMLQLCDILSSLHHFSPAIIHRDIKPSNIMVTPSGQIVLLDLNVAKYADASKTADTMLLGTHGYAAPEQYGFGSSNIQTDIYAVGVLMNTLLIGKLPQEELASGRFGPIIRKSTKLNPNDRYQTIDALRKAIADLNLYHTHIPVMEPAYSGSWLPPGFRSKNVLHMGIGILGYAMILYFGCNLEIENATPFTLVFERFASIVMFLAMVFFSWNYRNIQSVFPFCSHPNKTVRLFVIMLYDLFIGVLVILLMILVENALLAFL